MSMLRRSVLIVMLALLAWVPAPLAAEEPAANTEPGPAPAAETVGTIRGTNVNIRVGPRVDGTPILKLHDGAAVVIVERVPDWYGVRIPQGLPAAVSSRYVAPAGEDVVVTATKLNLRMSPPIEGKPMPAVFRDAAVEGDRLSVIRREGDWTWVVAPERVRAYVHARYVTELGPVAEHGDVLAKARAKRATWVAQLARNRLQRRVADASDALRDAIGDVQEQLHGLRLRGDWDRHPVVALGNVLDGARERHPLASARLRRLAEALRADLESEVTLRVARRDAAVAKARGLSPDPEKLPAPKVSSVTFQGVLRWESVPKWRNGGAWILWQNDKPTHVVRLTTGMPLPHPKLADHADGKPRTIQGHQPGERLFGLPVIALKSIKK